MARRLGYRPNPAARSLLKRRTGGVGVLIPYITGGFFGELLHGIDETAKQRGVFLLISVSHEQEDEWKEAVAVMLGRVDGLLAMSVEHPPDALGLPGNVPIALINCSSAGADGKLNADLFNFDNEGGARLLTEHLLELGHRRILCVRGPRGVHDADSRVRGYRRAMRDAGLGEAEQRVILGGYEEASGYDVVDGILGDPEPPTGIVAANDYCAAGILAALRDRGVTVPDQISVTGFDNLSSSQYLQPPLTSAHVPVREIGVAAISRVIDRVLGLESGPVSSTMIPVRLVRRESTAAPRV